MINAAFVQIIQMIPYKTKNVSYTKGGNYYGKSFI